MAGNYYRVTLENNQSIQGWSETYISNGAWEVTQLGSELQNLINTRNAFMIDVDGWVGVRVANLGPTPSVQPLKRQSQFLRPGVRSLAPLVNVTIPSTGNVTVSPTATGDVQPAFLNMAALVQLQLANGTFTNRYLAGLRRNAFRYEPFGLDTSQLGASLNDINAYLALLVSKWSVWGRIPDPDEPKKAILNFTNETPTGGKLGVVLATTGAPDVSQKNLIQLTANRAKRFSGVSVAGSGSVNGKWYVDSVANNAPATGQTTWWLRGTEGLLASSVKKFGFVQRVLYQPVAIQQAKLTGAATHKRGRPIGARRGRRLIRVSLDP